MSAPIDGLARNLFRTLVSTDTREQVMTKSKCFGMMAAGIVLGSSSLAQAGDLPGGYNCRDLRSTVASYGAQLVLTAARSRGIPEYQIVSIRRRCRV